VTGESSGEIPLLSFVKDSVHGPVLEEELPERTVVLGIGNVLLSDEGVGVHAIKALAQRYEETKQVEIVDGGTAGIEGEQVPAYFKTKLSPHQVGLSDVLAALAFKGTIPGQVVLIGVQPVKLSLGMDLSPEVNARLEEVVSMVRAELAKLQCRPAISQNLR
jgi:hydrogenase maturation protease